MKKLFIICMCLIFGLSQLYAEKDKVVIPPDDNWEETEVICAFIEEELLKLNLKFDELNKK